MTTQAAEAGWILVSSTYCQEETRRNLGKLEKSAERYFDRTLRRRIHWSGDTLTSQQVVVFPKAKDRPVLLSALATKCVALLTLDRTDFHDRLGRQFYGMSIRTPGEWLTERREAGYL